MSIFAGQCLSEKEKEGKDMKTRSIMTDTVRPSVCQFVCLFTLSCLSISLFIRVPNQCLTSLSDLLTDWLAGCGQAE